MGLLDALAELEDGRAPDLLKTSGKTRSVSNVEATFKGRVAAMVELLARAGDTIEQAAERVAAGLTKVGYAAPRAGKDGAPSPITATTVLAWRKEARNGRRYPATAVVYDRIVASATTQALSKSHLRKQAMALMAMLHQDRDSLRFLRVR